MKTSPDPRAVRAFIAIHLPEAVVAQLRQLQTCLRSALTSADIKWVRPEHIHLTLKFLGNVPADSVGSLATALQRACDGLRGFSLRFERVGAFPSDTKPRVLWVGVGGAVEQLMTLREQVDRETAPWSAHQEARDFRPHLTVARIKQLLSSERRRLAELIAAHRASALGEWEVREVTLMRSVLASEGPSYTSLATVPLLIG